MGLLPNPWVLLALIAACAGISGYAYHSGYEAAEEAMQLEVAALNERARESEQRMASRANTIVTSLKKANDDAQVQIERLRTDVATGARRLSIATRQVQPAGNAPASCGSGGQARAELDPEAARTLIAIAADGDAAIRQLNACIDLYNSVKGSTP